MSVTRIPAISVGEGEDVLFFMVNDGDDSLANHVNTDGQTEKLGLGPNVTVQRYPLVPVLSVECGN